MSFWQRNIFLWCQKKKVKFWWSAQETFWALFINESPLLMRSIILLEINDPIFVLIEVKNNWKLRYICINLFQATNAVHLASGDCWLASGVGLLNTHLQSSICGTFHWVTCVPFVFAINGIQNQLYCSQTTSKSIRYLQLIISCFQQI